MSDGPSAEANKGQMSKEILDKESGIKRRGFLKLASAVIILEGTSLACRRFGISDEGTEPLFEAKGPEFGEVPENSKFMLKVNGESKPIGIRYSGNIDKLQVRRSGFGGFDENGVVIYRPEEFVAGQEIARIPPEILELNLHELKVNPEVDEEGVGIWRTGWTTKTLADRVRFVKKDESVLGLPVATVLKEDMWPGGEYETNKLKLGAESRKITNGWAIGKLYGEEFVIEGLAPHHDVFVPAQSL